MRAREILTYAILVFSLVTNFASTAPAQRATTIQLGYMDAFDRTSPNPMNGITQHRSLRLTIDGSKSITENWTSGDKYSSYKWKEGTVLGAGWRVLGSSSLGRTDNFPNHQTVMRVVVTGKECSFTVSHNLKPGAQYYVWPMLSMPGRAGHYSRLVASFPTCKIE